MRDFDEQVWKVVTELNLAERGFNQFQHQYRLMASTWLLAMFAGVGFALSQQQLPVPSELIVSVVGLAGAVGVTQLWNLDLRVYHQLLDSCFVEGLKLEQEHHWLPPIRSGMMSSQNEQAAVDAKPAGSKFRSSRPEGVLARVVWFYMVGNSIALLTAFVGLAASLARQGRVDSSLGMLWLAAVGVTVIAVWDYEMYRNTRSPLLNEWITRQKGRAA